MKTAKKKQDRDSKQLAKILREYYIPAHPNATLDVYRYNSASIRLRVIDPDFAGTSLIERDDEIWAVMRERLPEDIISQLTVILLVTPTEAKKSIMNEEFEHPTPSHL
jgi:stress-induced morphogen